MYNKPKDVVLPERKLTGPKKKKKNGTNSNFATHFGYIILVMHDFETSAAM